MLETLRRIVQEITSAPNFAEALHILVARVRTAIGAQTCSVFLVDKTQQKHVMLATDGLENTNAKSVSVPIVHHRCLLGSLVVQQEQHRQFNETEEAFLITIAAQLGGIIAHAETTGAITRLLTRTQTQQTQHDIIFSGFAGAPGIGIGTAVLVYPPADLEAVPDRPAENIAAECAALSKALELTRKEIHDLSQRLNHLPEEEKALFEAYLHLLDSANLEQEIITEIHARHWAQGALRRVIRRRVKQFETMGNDYLRERAADIRDLGRRVLLHLQAGQRTQPHYRAQTILIGEEVTAAALAEVPPEKLVGVVSIKGSSNSHVAIMARALGVPTVIGVENFPIAQLEGQEFIVDGYQGHVYVAPSTKVRHNFARMVEQQREFAASLQELGDLPAQTQDGHTIALWINTGLSADIMLSRTAGAEGIGLYRTEIPFMDRDRFPTEEEQYVIYRQLLSAFAPRPVVMRTLDIGGDKILPYFPVTEDNPFLGWRGIRITLDHPEIFLMQIRAMLRASHQLNNLRVMLPMVSSAHEIQEALRLIKQAYAEVHDEGIAIQMPLIGVMIEVPSAIYIANTLAQQVDFLSVGSNDLTQYLLAVDRNNARVANLYDALHPAVLHALIHVVNAARSAGKPLNICGEMAGDPAAVLLLLAMGFNALSMNSTALLKIKRIIRHFSLEQAKALLAEVMLMDSAQQIRKHLEKTLCTAGLGMLVGAKK